MALHGRFTRRSMLAGLGTAGAAGVSALAAPGIATATPSRPATPRPLPTTDGWVGSWSTSMATFVPGTDGGYPNYSIRETLRISVGGSAIRVRLSNMFGATPVTFGHVTAAIATGPDTPAAAPGTMREVTFGGKPAITVPTGADVLSDPVELAVPNLANLLVTTYVPSASGPVSYHPDAQQNSFFTPNGDAADNVDGTAYPDTTQVWHYLTGVDVFAPEVRGSVVTFGDSITDGYQSTYGAFHRWPDILADRLAKLPRNQQWGVQNAGISGNRLLLNADPGSEGFGLNGMSRFDRDVVSRTGARAMIVLLGINDIQQVPAETATADALIAGHEQLIAQARVRGMRVIGATLTPFKGWANYNAALAATRDALNQWIRTGRGYDAVVDFDQAVRDPSDPEAMLPAYDSGDHLHPNDAGYQVMGNLVDLNAL